MAQKEFTRLSERDFEILLPTKVVKLGETEIDVKPLDLHDSNYFAACVREEWPTLSREFVERGITEDNVEEKLLDVADILITRSPMLLAVLSNVHPEDAARLPIMAVVDLLEAVFEMNFRDRDFFTIVSTVRRVADNVVQALGTGDVAAESARSRKSRKPSSNRGTRGRKSGATRGDSSGRSTSQRSNPNESSASPT